MPEEYSSEWESTDPSTKRLKIPSGWLVKTSAIIKEDNHPPSISCAMCFVLDVNHQWNFNKKMAVEKVKGSKAEIPVDIAMKVRQHNSNLADKVTE